MYIGMYAFFSIEIPHEPCKHHTVGVLDIVKYPWEALIYELSLVVGIAAFCNGKL